MQNYSKYDIIIVGLGPVGLFACNLFGKRGFSVLGIDRVQNAYNFPRAIHMDDEIVRLLQSTDLIDVIYPILKPSWGLEMLEADGRLMIKVDNKFPGGYEASNFLFLQPELEKILKSGIKRYKNVKLLYEVEVVDFKQEMGTIEIFSKDGKIAESTYMIGCDGAKSMVRSKLGIAFKNLKFTKSALKVDAFEESVNAKVIHSVQKTCSISKPYVYMQGVGQHRRWELNYNGGLSKEEIEKPENIQKLLSEIGVNVFSLKIVHAVYYTFRSELAEKWQKENIFLAGDAAHTTPPYVGQGMCSGFRDVMNLSWKIDAVLSNKMPASILNTFQSERYPHMKMQIKKAILIGNLFTTRWFYILKLLSHIPILNKKLLKITLPFDSYGKGFWGEGKARRYLFPQVRNKQNEMSDNLYDNNWALVSIGRQFNKETIELCNKYELKPIVLGYNDYNVSELVKWAAKYKAQYFIVRPDLYVYSSGNNPLLLCTSYISNCKKLWN